MRFPGPVAELQGMLLFLEKAQATIGLDHHVVTMQIVHDEFAVSHDRLSPYRVSFRELHNLHNNIPLIVNAQL